ncbi:MAG: ribonuclease P protein component [Bacteroidetes bacterium]|nr:ribonuclease P protein component [Bacteroidota bacterium]
MRQTLPKSIILRGYQSFTKVISSGTALHGTLLTAFLLTNADDRKVLIGFSVPKKQVPLAAHRNRIKRLMREVVRRDFSGVITAAEGKDLGARIVLMFRRDRSHDILRLTLHDLEPVWTDLRQRILKAL